MRANLLQFLFMGFILAGAWTAGAQEDPIWREAFRELFADEELAEELIAKLEIEPAPLPSSCDDYEPTRRPLFGDLHVHTSYSMDTAILAGFAENDPAAAYRFARGEEIGVAPRDADGKPRHTIRLRRPLDFAAVTDHADFFAEQRLCLDTSHAAYELPECRALRELDRPNFARFWGRLLTQPMPPEPNRFEFCGPGDKTCRTVAKVVWAEVRAAAETADDPCEFTTFAGYEWTGGPDRSMIHRNVIFSGVTVPELPASYLDTPWPEDLWSTIEKTCLAASGGCDAIIIPHSTNFSQGKMFPERLRAGRRPMTPADAARRVRLERLAEVVQHKGVSECRPELGNTDELCGFELARAAAMVVDPLPGTKLRPHHPLDFMRNVLKEGLRLEKRLRVDPYRLGFVGGTDTHNAAPGYVDEEGWVGHHQVRDSAPAGRLTTVDWNPGGLSAVWAEQNNREAVFAALKRREVYATSGPRMTVRFFGGFFLPEQMCGHPDFARLGYGLGVAMGGELEGTKRDVPYAPRFAVSALKDAGGTSQPLERVQIIKGWLDNGRAAEKVYDVAGEAMKTFDSLCTVWEDPDFDPAQSAFYYARVLEKASPRWSTYLCRSLEVDCSDTASVPEEHAACCRPDVPESIQERAWTSPIWYVPPP